MKVDIVTSDDTKIYYTGKFQGFTAGYIINVNNLTNGVDVIAKPSSWIHLTRDQNGNFVDKDMFFFFCIYGNGRVITSVFEG